MDTETNSIDDGPSEFMFAFRKTNFSQMKSAVVSPVCTVKGLQWQIVINKHENKKFPGLGQYLGFNLCCNKGVNKYWSCSVQATLSIVTQKKGIPSFFRILQNSFSWLENEWGFSEFMDWHDVVNPERGYIDDDTVKFQAHIIANPPKIVNLSLNSRDNVDEDLTNNKTKDDPKKIEDMLHLFANEMDENIFRRVSQELKEVAESLGIEQQSNLDGAIKRLKSDLKVYMDSVVLNFREDINSLKNTEKSCPTCCNSFKKENGIDEDKIVKTTDRIEIASSNSKPHFVQSMKDTLESLNQKMNEVLLLSQSMKPDICYSNSPRIPESYSYIDRISQFSYPDQDLESDMHCHNEFNSQYSHQFECCCAQNYADRENDGLSCIYCQKRQNGRNVEFESQIGFNVNSYKQKSQVEDMSINKALQKEILLIGKDENGQLKTYKPTSAEELTALKQKYQSSEVLEMMKFEI